MSISKTAGFALVLLMVAITSSARADILYTVDNVSDELFSIDTDTGQVTSIGITGMGNFDVDLTFLGGQLYGIRNDFTNQEAELVQFDLNTGAVTGLAMLSQNGNAVTNAEGLGSVNGQLVAGFTTGSNDFSSSQLGVLSLTGEISGSQNTGTDMDALGGNASDQLYSVDNRPNGALVDRDFLTLSPTNLLGTTTDTFAFTDIAFSGGRLFAIGAGADSQLVELDPLNGSVRNSITLSRSGSYRGLAASAVPEPSAAVWLGLASAVGFATRRRQRGQES